MYQTAIFDLDGTLLNTLDDLADAVNYALKKFGYPARTVAEVRRFVGNGIANLMSRSLPNGEKTPDFDEVLSNFRAFYEQNSQNKTAPYEGILPLLARLRERGVRVAVVSNKFDAAVAALSRRYFGDLVEIAVGESPDRAKKPAPDGIFYALDRLGMPREGAVYIGDSEVDVITAQNAGIPCISVLWGFRDRKEIEAAGGNLYATAISELEYLLT
ncbi:MAG: HAD-IA family hydrolase [Clostridia bacterium]|nr:HAD-IA family hydrolase [Clostridia bacterium]